jgi:hypothetical protein
VNRTIHGLVVAIGARGLHTALLQLLDDVFLGALQTRAAGLAAFHVVVGENFYVVPPRRTVEILRRRSLLRERGCGDGEACDPKTLKISSQRDAPFHFVPTTEKRITIRWPLIIAVFLTGTFQFSYTRDYFTFQNRWYTHVSQ